MKLPVGSDYRQYGISARGLAIDTALEPGEEFPRFTDFWLERPAKNSALLTVYSLMDSPSTAGAYRFTITPRMTLNMDIDAALYPRKAIERIGIAPLTSMYQHGENDRRMANDWRPEIHDSDGLSLLTGSGEWIWRPLVNPLGIRVSSYFGDNPRGFRLLQRDRNFDLYKDNSVFYERRPSVRIEPKNDSGQGWGRGAVQLVELPAPDETTITSSLFGILPTSPRQANSCYSATASTGARKCELRHHWPKLPIRELALEGSSANSGNTSQARCYRQWFSDRTLPDNH